LHFSRVHISSRTQIRIETIYWKRKNTYYVRKLVFIDLYNLYSKKTNLSNNDIYAYISLDEDWINVFYHWVLSMGTKTHLL